MIKSDREKARKLQEIKDCEKIIEQNRELLTRIGLPEEQISANIQPTIEIRDRIQMEVEEYDSLQSGKEPSATSIEGIGDLLVKLRIFQKLTQKALADKIGVDETQVSRDERNHYKGVSLERLLKVVTALGVNVEVTVHKQEEQACVKA